ncbi:hypothetical protein F4818DRAFT_252447 [Hypoxylon cercidicola]|nr:hypothetical protein F4818DRAFT_252447 [Hypoxylon cercidicola]
MSMSLVNWLAKKYRRLRWRLELLHTPFRFRKSLGILRRLDGHPYLSLLRLLWPVPWYFSCRLPPRPREIIAYEKETYFDQHYPDLYDLRIIPLWRWRDTPQRSFFRLYEALCAHDEPYIGYETEYFWKRSSPSWELERLCDPSEYGCTDPEQYAVMASLAEALADSFNWRLGWGFRRDGNHVERDDLRTPMEFTPVKPPSWASSVPALEETLIIHDYGRQIGSDDSYFTGSVQPFEKRNIEASTASLRTI